MGTNVAQKKKTLEEKNRQRIMEMGMGTETRIGVKIIREWRNSSVRSSLIGKE